MTISWEATLLGVLVAIPLAVLPATPAPATTPPATVSITLDQEKASVAAGDRLSFTSTVRNEGDQRVTGLIGHLNIVALDPEVYVDPEDWSSNRTQYVAALPAHGSVRLTWNVQAVGSGRFILYVGVTQRHTSKPVTGSVPLQLDVSRRRTLNASSVLPLAVSVPTAVLLLMAAAARRRRRLS